MTRKLRIGVIFGGRSVEHEVSLMSARSLMEAIDPDRFEVVPIGVTKEGRWLTSGDPLRALSNGDARRITREAVAAMIPGLCAERTPGGSEAGLVSHSPAAGGSGFPRASLDAVFPLVHGIYGEDGTLQGLLELADLPYVGAGVLGSAVGMDKDISKQLLERHGLPIVPYRTLTASAWPHLRKTALEEIVQEVGLPCFVKPSGSGSSVGVSKVREARLLAGAVEHAFQYDRKILIERAVDAREIEVAILGNDAPEASVPGEIIPCHEFYDYAAKYLEESQLLVPAPLEPSQADEARRLALEAFRVLELAGLARVDLFLDRRAGSFYLNEVNSLPGFTPVSMYPRLWQASGLSYRDLISRLIDLALERHRSRKSLKTSYSQVVGS